MGNCVECSEKKTEGEKQTDKDEHRVSKMEKFESADDSQQIKDDSIKPVKKNVLRRISTIDKNKNLYYDKNLDISAI